MHPPFWRNLKGCRPPKIKNAISEVRIPTHIKIIFPMEVQRRKDPNAVSVRQARWLRTFTEKARHKITDLESELQRITPQMDGRTIGLIVEMADIKKYNNSLD